MESPIVIALDGMSRAEALTIADTTAGRVWGYKVHDLFLREPSIITDLKARGKVFIDLKFHDIPATVEKEVAAMMNLGADLMTVHAAGGSEMLMAAVKVGSDHIVAVTVLTSLSDASAVPTLAKLAHDAGISNIVCSPQEIGIVRSATPTARIITPGIRGPEDAADDQRRTLSAREAIDAGAGLLVIGRPITKAPHPGEALEKIIASLS